MKAGTFQKGDSRINKHGRPKNLDSFRKLARDISHEVIDTPDGKMTRAESILRQWAKSKNPKMQLAFVEYAFGKPAAEIEVSGRGGNDIRLHVEKVDYRRGLDALAPDDDSTPVEE